MRRSAVASRATRSPSPGRSRRPRPPCPISSFQPPRDLIAVLRLASFTSSLLRTLVVEPLGALRQPQPHSPILFHRPHAVGRQCLRDPRIVVRPRVRRDRARPAFTFSSFLLPAHVVRSFHEHRYPFPHVPAPVVRMLVYVRPPTIPVRPVLRRWLGCPSFSFGHRPPPRSFFPIPTRRTCAGCRAGAQGTASTYRLFGTLFRRPRVRRVYHQLARPAPAKCLPNRSPSETVRPRRHLHRPVRAVRARLPGLAERSSLARPHSRARRSSTHWPHPADQRQRLPPL